MPATKQTTTPTIGSVVTYHGSLTDSHGQALVLDWCECEECWELNLTRFVLVPLAGGRSLQHVRPESFA